MGQQPLRQKELFLHLVHLKKKNRTNTKNSRCFSKPFAFGRDTGLGTPYSSYSFKRDNDQKTVKAQFPGMMSRILKVSPESKRCGENSGKAGAKCLHSPPWSTWTPFSLMTCGTRGRPIRSVAPLKLHPNPPGVVTAWRRNHRWDEAKNPWRKRRTMIKADLREEGVNER